MTQGKAQGIDRKYQETCRDIITERDPTLIPYQDDGIDIVFDLPDTKWTIDVALRTPSGSLVVAESRRTASSSKQEDMAAFAYKVEMLRRSMGVKVAGIFMTKTGHQIGAVRVAQHAGITVAVLAEGSTPSAFNITFLRYDAKREKKLRDIVMKVAPATLGFEGGLVALVIRGKAS